MVAYGTRARPTKLRRFSSVSGQVAAGRRLQEAAAPLSNGLEHAFEISLSFWRVTRYDDGN